MTSPNLFLGEKMIFTKQTQNFLIIPDYEKKRPEFQTACLCKTCNGNQKLPLSLKVCFDKITSNESMYVLYIFIVITSSSYSHVTSWRVYSELTNKGECSLSFFKFFATILLFSCNKWKNLPSILVYSDLIIY